MSSDSWKASRFAQSGPVLAAGIILAVAIILLAMGREPICKCFLFYGLFWCIGKEWPVTLRLCLALAIEGAWEVFENTDLIVNRYREATISLDYYGDSVINSVSDVVAMAIGFYGASRMAVWLTIILALAMELIVGAVIRDNLTLNIIMLIHPLDAIKAWQGGS